MRLDLRMYRRNYKPHACIAVPRVSALVWYSINFTWAPTHYARRSLIYWFLRLSASILTSCCWGNAQLSRNINRICTDPHKEYNRVQSNCDTLGLFQLNINSPRVMSAGVRKCVIVILFGLCPENLDTIKFRRGLWSQRKRRMWLVFLQRHSTLAPRHPMVSTLVNRILRFFFLLGGPSSSSSSALASEKRV